MCVSYESVGVLCESVCVMERVCVCVSYESVCVCVRERGSNVCV